MQTQYYNMNLSEIIKNTPAFSIYNWRHTKTAVPNSFHGLKSDVLFKCPPVVPLNVYRTQQPSVIWIGLLQETSAVA